MKRVCNLLIAGVSCSMLFACTVNPQARVDDAVNQIKKTTSGVVTPIVDTAKEVEKRVKQVQSGALMIKNGIEAVKGSVR